MRACWVERQTGGEVVFGMKEYARNAVSATSPVYRSLSPTQKVRAPYMKGGSARLCAYFVRAFRVTRCSIDNTFFKLCAYTAFFAYPMPWRVQQ